jgi:SAM-dependent methyltransferase
MTTVNRIARAVRRLMDPVPENVFVLPLPQRRLSVLGPLPGAAAVSAAMPAAVRSAGTRFVRLAAWGRRDKLLHGLALTHMVGAEIGPLDRPLVRKGDGAVFYVDHLDTAALRDKWRTDPNVDISKLQVDAVWGRQTLRQGIAAAAGADEDGFAGLDYVVASHVVEHVPDLITWLQEIQAVLKPGGQLRLAVPDKRFTFDYLRRTTDLASVVHAWQSKARVPGPQCILDFCLHMVDVDSQAAWRARLEPATLRRRYDFAAALAIAQGAERDGAYHDVHCWVFTPASMAQLLAELARLRLIAFACERFHDTEVDRHEFFVALRQCDDAALCAASWESMAAQARVHAYSE